MKMHKIKFNKQNSNASSAIEFMAVFSFLFVFFILILDVGLFFRQIYLTQTIADEVLSRLTIEKQCSANLEKTAEIANETVAFYFIEQNFTATKKNKMVELSANQNKYNFLISCRNEITPDSLIFVYKYKGVMMYRNGKEISSNVSVNTTYY